VQQTARVHQRRTGRHGERRAPRGYVLAGEQPTDQIGGQHPPEDVAGGGTRETRLETRQDRQSDGSGGGEQQRPGDPAGGAQPGGAEVHRKRLQRDRYRRERQRDTDLPGDEDRRGERNHHGGIGGDGGGQRSLCDRLSFGGNHGALWRGKTTKNSVGARLTTGRAPVKLLAGRGESVMGLASGCCGRGQGGPTTAILHVSSRRPNAATGRNTRSPCGLRRQEAICGVAAPPRYMKFAAPCIWPLVAATRPITLSPRPASTRSNDRSPRRCVAAVPSALRTGRETATADHPTSPFPARGAPRP